MNPRRFYYNIRKCPFQGICNDCDGKQLADICWEAWEREKIQRLFALWLEKFSWNLWGTFTFRWSASVDSAMRCFKDFWQKIHNCNGYFVACEWFSWMPQGVHLHALLDVEIPYVKELWRRWFDRYGRNRIEFLWNDTEGVRQYCSKYITKDLTEWDIWQKQGDKQRLLGFISGKLKELNLATSS